MSSRLCRATIAGLFTMSGNCLRIGQYARVIFAKIVLTKPMQSA